MGARSTVTLRQWPVQLHLVSPAAPTFRGADVLLAATCVAYAVGDFHRDYLAGRALAIACTKLDAHQGIYLEKLVALTDHAGIAALTVMIMEVPCCGGLLQLARTAAERSARKVPLRSIVVGIRDDLLASGSAPASAPCPASRCGDHHATHRVAPVVAIPARFSSEDERRACPPGAVVLAAHTREAEEVRP